MDRIKAFADECWSYYLVELIARFCLSLARKRPKGLQPLYLYFLSWRNAIPIFKFLSECFLTFCLPLFVSLYCFFNVHFVVKNDRDIWTRFSSIVSFHLFRFIHLIRICSFFSVKSNYISNRENWKHVLSQSHNLGIWLSIRIRNDSESDTQSSFFPRKFKQTSSLIQGMK